MKRLAIAACALVLSGCANQYRGGAYSGHDGVHYNPTGAQIERSQANDAVNAQAYPYRR